MTSHRYYRRPLLFPDCQHGPCLEKATHELIDGQQGKIGDYCHDHATERVMAMNAAHQENTWSPSGQGGR